MKKTETQFDLFVNSLQIKQIDGADARYGQTVTELTARRVQTDRDGEHVQIGVVVRSTKTGKRWLAQHGSLSLSPAEVQPLITALTKLMPKHDSSEQRLGFSEEQSKWADFYGLAPHPKGYYGSFVPNPAGVGMVAPKGLYPEKESS